MIREFINRKGELEFLEERHKNKKFEFFVIYGRRRVGKTELIKHFIRNKLHIYLLCDKSGTKKNVYRFKKKVSEFLGEPIIATNDLEEVFSYLIKRAGKKVIVVFDEFSYLAEKDPAVPSLFQVVCDELLKNKDIFLILCGSSISMMEKGVLSSKSPLYGRKTAHIKLTPIHFKHFNKFFPLNSLEKNIEFYSILDGIPSYLETFSDKKATLENIKEQIWSKEGRLYEEIDFLLREELREPDVYKTILDAIASGKTKVVEIANKSGIKVQDLDKYLKVLIKLGIIKKEIPLTEVKSKKSLYSIKDNLFNFCFLFSEPYKSDLEIRELKNAEEKFKKGFDSFIGRKFEGLIKREVLKKAGIMQIQKAGRQWGKFKGEKGKNTYEIDLVALNDNTKDILFCECKWQEKIDAEKIIKELMEKSGHVSWHNEERKEHFAVFAKSFKKKIKKFENKKVHCFDLKDIGKILRKKGQ
ncbi:hypothetical protein A3K73_00910 [Candidatus Pacearchaeota archaeon RBG_13_36_9]|nr:MAG: hypothetical protein A3K73_00910 [Candidatus Pacearchaeota archaeon RBG_13_36_9]